MIDFSRQGAVALLRYDRGGKANALSMEAIEALADAARKLAEDDSVSVAVLTGTHKLFSAGVDLEDDRIWRAGATEAERRRAMAVGGEMCALWAGLPQVTIAAVEGAAIGGGGILAMANDFRILAEGAFFRFPEVRLGMTFGWGGLASLASLVGASVTKRLLFTGQRVEADQAFAMGLCEEVVAKGGAVDRAMALAEEIAQCPQLALRMTKRSVDAELRSNWASGFEADQSLLSHIAAKAKA